MRRKSKRFLAIALAGILGISPGIPSKATEVEGIQTEEGLGVQEEPEDSGEDTGEVSKEEDAVKEEERKLLEEEKKQKAEEYKKQTEESLLEQQLLISQLNAILEEMQRTEETLKKKAEEVQKAEEEYVQIKLDENRQYDEMKERIKYMYESGNTQVFEIMLGAHNFADFINRADYIIEVSKYDKAAMDSLKKAVAKTEEKEEQLKKEYDEMQKLKEQQNKRREEVNKYLDTENQELLTLIAKIQTEFGEESGLIFTEAGASRIVGEGIFAYPCPSGQISSGFGYRDFDHSFHKGVDFATGGAKVPTYAAADGKVVIAGWSESAGNWVVIDHGGGLVTKYMHHSSLTVRPNQTVKKGQQIGVTGNTGYSSGVHLHFQVEVNGTAVDPMDYLLKAGQE